MSANVVMPLIFLVLVILYAANAIWTGRAIYGSGFNLRPVYAERSRNPVWFWIIMAFYVAMAVEAVRLVLWGTISN